LWLRAPLRALLAQTGVGTLAQGRSYLLHEHILRTPTTGAYASYGKPAVTRSFYNVLLIEIKICNEVLRHFFWR
jgi:hypothetical protein